MRKCLQLDTAILTCEASNVTLRHFRAGAHSGAFTWRSCGTVAPVFRPFQKCTERFQDLQIHPRRIDAYAALCSHEWTMDYTVSYCDVLLCRNQRATIEQAILLSQQPSWHLFKSHNPAATLPMVVWVAANMVTTSECSPLSQRISQLCCWLLGFGGPSCVLILGENLKLTSPLFQAPWVNIPLRFLEMIKHQIFPGPTFADPSDRIAELHNPWAIVESSNQNHSNSYNSS